MLNWPTAIAFIIFCISTSVPVTVAIYMSYAYEDNPIEHLEEVGEEERSREVILHMPQVPGPRLDEAG